MADRMMQDMSFDITPAKIDFGYNPRPFLIDPIRDLSGLTAKGKIGWYEGLKLGLNPILSVLHRQAKMTMPSNEN